MRRAFLAALTVVAALSSVCTTPFAASAPPAPNMPLSMAEPRAHADRVVDYTLRASLDPSGHTIHGEGTIRWRNASSTSVRELWLHLYLNAFKNERSVFFREPVGGFRGTRVPTDWGAIDVRRLAIKNVDGTITDLWPLAELHRPNDEDETDVRVPLPRDVVSNETIELEVVWDDKLPPVIERTGYDGTFHFAGQWFPKLARLESDGTWAHFPFHHLAEFYADFGSYDVTLDVPSNFRIGATGPTISSSSANGRLVERHVQDDVHDFAWTAWDRFQLYSEEMDGVAVAILYPPGYERDAQREIATIRFALPYYSAHYGRYPYPVLTLVHPPRNAGEAGGMEYPTLITTGGPWYDPAGIREVELTTIHEFGHQYFYGLIATNEVEWPFLDEGLNSYAEENALGAWLGQGSLASIAGLTISDAAIHSVFSQRAATVERVAQPAYSFATGGDYARLVYSRTASILETFRRVYGDEQLTRALTLYTTRYRFAHPTPDDLFACFNEVIGTEPVRTMRAAFFDRGWVDYAVINISSRKSSAATGLFDRNGKRETVVSGNTSSNEYEGWVLVSRRGTLSFPVTVELRLEDGTTRRLTWNGADDTARLSYEGSSAILSATIDPDHAVTIDENPTNNFASVNVSPGAPRSLERLAYWIETLVQMILP